MLSSIYNKQRLLSALAILVLTLTISTVASNKAHAEPPRGMPAGINEVDVNEADKLSGTDKLYRRLYKTAKRKDHSVGRNILADGVRVGGGKRSRPARLREIRRSIRVLRVMLAPPVVVSAPVIAPVVPSTQTGAPAAPTAAPTAAAPTGGAGGGALDGIAQCESGSDPGAVSNDGQYTGLYQFDDQTWRSVGGSGRAKDASPAEQHARAGALQRAQGSSPWPNCG